MKEAFNYMFKDNAYCKKAFSYFIVAFISTFLMELGSMYIPDDYNAPLPIEAILLIVFGCILTFFISGYFVFCTKALIEQKENYILPFFDIKNTFLIGFKNFLSVVIAFVAVSSVSILCAILPFIIFSIVAHAINSQILSIVTNLILLLALITLITLFSVLYLICFPAFLSMFAKKQRLTTFLRFISAFKLIKKGASNYFKYFGMNILFSIVCLFINLIFGILLHLFKESVIYVLLYSLFASLIASYTIFVYAYLIAKSTKIECADENLVL